jgi:hypothetical protein
MAEIDVGGDTSVLWKIDVDNVRKDAIKNGAKKGTANGHRQEGVDETDDSEFRVRLKLPSSRDDFIQSLETESVGGRTFVSFSLPIEDGNGKPGDDTRNPDQIRITWTSREASAARSSAPAARSRTKAKTSARKRPRKRAR